MSWKRLSIFMSTMVSAVIAPMRRHTEEQPTLSAGHFEAVCRELVTVAPE